MTAKARTARTAPKATVEAPATEAPVEAPATPATEAPVATDTATTEAPAVPTGPTVIKVGALIIDVADVTATVQAYSDATVGDKTKIRNAITAAMGQAVMGADLATAQAMATAQKALTDAAPAKQEIDYTQVVIDRAIGLAYAAKRLGYGDILPEGIDEARVDKARVEAAFRAYMSGDMDAVTDAQAAVAKVGAAKVTRTTERGDVEAHIMKAFDGTKIGTRLTVAQIRTASGAKSDGAIAARVWPVDAKTKAAKESTLDFTAMGVRPCLIDGVRGMEKFADATDA